jgi:hypothetical protein
VVIRPGCFVAAGVEHSNHTHQEVRTRIELNQYPIERRPQIPFNWRSITVSIQYTPPRAGTERLIRVQQLTLNTWRLAAAKLQRQPHPENALEQAAVHALLATLRDVRRPLDLFVRHAQAAPDFAFIRSLVEERPRDEDLAYDVLDMAFLLRWNELVADGSGPEVLPPLGSRRVPSECSPRASH